MESQRLYNSRGNDYSHLRVVKTSELLPGLALYTLEAIAIYPEMRRYKMNFFEALTSLGARDLSFFLQSNELSCQFVDDHSSMLFSRLQFVSEVFSEPEMSLSLRRYAKTVGVPIYATIDGCRLICDKPTKYWSTFPLQISIHRNETTFWYPRLSATERLKNMRLTCESCSSQKVIVACPNKCKTCSECLKKSLETTRRCLSCQYQFTIRESGALSGTYDFNLIQCVLCDRFTQVFECSQGCYACSSCYMQEAQLSQRLKCPVCKKKLKAKSAALVKKCVQEKVQESLSYRKRPY